MRVVMDRELQAVADVTEDVTDVAEPSEPEEVEEESEEETPDPLAELRTQFTDLQTQNARLEQIVRAGTGRTSKLQNDLNAVMQRGQAPQASDPRIEAHDATISGIVDALANADWVEPQAKAQLQALRGQLEQSRSARSQDQLRAELLQEVKEAQTPQRQQDDPEVAAYVAQIESATSNLQGYASAKGVDWASIPATVLQFREGETLQQSSARVQVAIDEMAQEETGTANVASRRKAAGTGTAPRSAGTGSVDQDKTRLMENGIPMTDEAARKRVAESLGLTL